MLLAGGAVLSTGVLSGTAGASDRSGATGAVRSGEDVPVSRVPSTTEVLDDDGVLAVRSDALRLGSTAPAVRTTGSATDDDIEVSVRIPSLGPSVSTDGTAEVWVGAHDTSGVVGDPLEGEDLTVRIDRPDGDEDVFEVATGTDGNAVVEYDLADPDRQDGTYNVSVEHDAVGFPASASFDVGTQLDFTTRGHHSTLVGEEITVAVLARNGEDPEPAIDVELSVTGPAGESIVAETVPTDGHGFASIAFTPATTGRHSVQAETVDGDASASMSVSVVDVTVPSNLLLRHGISGGTARYGGYLRDVDGLVPNTEFTIELYTRFEDELVFEETVTTDDVGFFFHEMEIPDDVDDDLDMEASLPDDREIELSVDRLRVNEFDDTDPDPVSFSASLSSFRIAPGSEAELVVEADDDGEPIADAEVELFLRYEFNGPPLFSTTVTTGADGTATTSVPIPDDAPDGSSLRGDAAMVYDGEQYASSLWGDIQRYDVWFDTETIPGEPSELSIEVFDRETEEPVEEFPFLYDTQYAYHRGGSFGTGLLRSDDDGQDASTVDIPADVEFIEYANYRTRYTDNVYRWLEPDRPGELSVVDDQVAAGDTVEFEFITPDGSDARGIAFAEVHSPRQTIGTTVSTDGTGTVSIPARAAGDWLWFRLWAADEAGNLYSDNVSVQVEDEPETVARFDVDPAEPVPDETVTFDASESSAATGTLSYEWDFDDGTTAEGEVVEHAYATEGTYTVTLTVVDGADATDTAVETVDVSEETDDRSIEDYADDDGTVSATGVLEAFADWQAGEIDATLVLEVFSAWQSGEEVA